MSQQKGKITDSDKNREFKEWEKLQHQQYL